MNRIFAYGLFFLLLLNLWSTGSAQDFFEKADQFFQKHVKNGRIDYQAVRNQKEDIRELDRIMRDYPVKEKKASTQKAFWINAYNLTVIKSVVRNYPVSNVQTIEGFFSLTEHKVGGKLLTLDEIEGEKLYEKFSDPRLHFVLVCAAEGCPKIVDYAYQPNQLDQQLNKRTRITLRDPNFIRLQPEKNKVLISEIFKWYREHFVADNQTVIDYINQYRKKTIPSSYEVDYYNYDWTLNDAKKN